MSLNCCVEGLAVEMAEGAAGRPTAPAPAVDPRLYVRQDETGHCSLDLMISGLHCAACIRDIERAVTAVPDVTRARVNLGNGRLALAWTGAPDLAVELAARVAKLGYGVAAFDPAKLDEATRNETKKLVRALAVAGFAAGNVMLLSVSVWAGASDATRDLFHWISAMIALPAIAYAGRPFFVSGWASLRARRMTMDVPISLAVILASAASLMETIRGAEHAYFDAAISLVFFLLIGRVLDQRARARARSAAEHLLALTAVGATVVEDDGTLVSVPAEHLKTGQRVMVPAGQRLPCDGAVAEGRGDIDTQLVTGESVPVAVAPGDKVHAGTLNLSSALIVTVGAAGEATLLAEIARLLTAAEQSKAKYVQIADRLARFYSPAVHVVALAAGLSWLVGGADPHTALMIAVATLIVTCPCALALAVPAVQTVATGRLLKSGVLIKAADALERLAQVDTVVMDKTGTLTEGRPWLTDTGGAEADLLAAARAVARHSTHPLAQAIAASGPNDRTAADVVERPGEGVVGTVDGVALALGQAGFIGIEDAEDRDASGSVVWIRYGDGAPVRLVFEDAPRADAAEVVAALKARGLTVELLSGDRPGAVAAAARRAGIETWRAGVRPDEKLAHIRALADAGHKVLMVGDGMNDAPALAAGHASLAPGHAADVSQIAADAVFQGERLAPMIEVLTVARSANRLVKQNFALAIGYNGIAVPLAVAGLVTPLVAAICMSASSLVVTANALRLGMSARRATATAARPRTTEVPAE